MRVRIVEVDTGGNAGGSFIGKNAPGTARIVVDEDRGVVVGATITAIVAAWSDSATSAPVIVAPTTTRRSSSTTIRAVPGALLPMNEPPAFPPVSTSTRAPQPGLLAATAVRPTAPTCGSVKITRGEAPPSERRRTSLPRIASAARRAWYFPMCVSSARPFTSPTA